MFNEQVRALLEERASMHDNDPMIEQHREKLIKLLSLSEKAAIGFLKSCSKEDALWISEVYEDVAYNLQSWEYIDSLKSIDIKYPDLKITRTIQIAEDYMNPKK